MARILTDAEAEIAKATEAAIARGEDPFGDEEEIVAPGAEEFAAEDAAKLDAEQPGAQEPPVREKKTRKAKAQKAAEPEPEEAKEEAKGEEEETDVATALAEAAGIDTDDDDVEEGDAEEEPEEAVVDDELTPEEEALLMTPRADLTDIDKRRDEAQDKLDEIDVKRMDGEISAAEANKLARPFKNQLDDINAERAAALQDNRMRERIWEASIQAIKKLGKTEKSVDYEKDIDAATVFDAAWRSIAATAREPLTPRQLHMKAHAIVLATRGITKARASSGAASKKAEPAAKTAKPVAAKPAKDEVPPPRTATKAPLTLRGLPSAGVANSGGDAKAALARLPGDQFQKAYSKLSQAQKDALTSTDD